MVYLYSCVPAASLPSAHGEHIAALAVVPFPFCALFLLVSKLIQGVKERAEIA